MVKPFILRFLNNMIKPLSYLIVLLSLLNISTADAQKRKLYESRLKFDPQLEALWFEDGQGNEITEGDDYEIEVGATLELVIQANKDANGELANIDMEEEACTYRLVSDDYKLVNGFVSNIVLNGDSLDPKKDSENPKRELNNLTRLKFIGIEETDQCLEDYEQELAKREKRKWCKKRSWPYRSWGTSKRQNCR